MRTYHFTTGTGTPALNLVSATGCAFLGMAATCAEAAAYFVKIWWGGTAAGTELPVIGTTAPNLTIQVPTTGTFQEFNHPLQGGGPMWVAATKNAGDTDDTALTTGGDVISLFVD